MKVINIRESKVSKVKAKAKKVLGKSVNKVTRKVMSIDLDGQRRGEVIFRRVVILIALVLAIYVLLDLLVDKGYIQTNEQRHSQIVIVEPVEALEQAEVVEVAHETTPEKQVPLKLEPIDKVNEFVTEYGGRIDYEYMSYLRVYCSENTLRQVIAIAVAETSMGKNTDKKTNLFGWHKGGNKSYDPSKEEMAKEICTGIARSYSSVGGSYAVADKYTGKDRTSSWLINYNWAIDQMK